MSLTRLGANRAVELEVGKNRLAELRGIDEI
jgi:hypothetical protein